MAGSPVSVIAGGSISVEMVVVTSGSGNANDWESTAWNFATSLPGSFLCVDSANFTDSGTHTTTFTIVAPALHGLYNGYFRAHDGGSCGASDPSPVVTLKGGLTVLPPATNPPLAEACGLDIVLVIDVSGSIGDDLPMVKQAAHDFVNAFLPSTPTLVGLVKFSDTATVLENLTNNATALNADIDALTAGGFTNWEAALIAAKGLLESGLDRDDNEHPDLIVKFTDGDPTASSAGASNSAQPNFHLAPAVTVANAAKTSSASDPIRIIAVGVSGATVNRLIAISGTNVSPPSPIDATVDVITSSFADLAEALSDLALAFCGGTITAHKLIDEDGNLGTTSDQTDGSGWMFNSNPDPPDTSDPPSGTTDSAGLINFEIDLGANNSAVVDIVEKLQSAFTFNSASCKKGVTPVGTPGANRVDNIPLGPLDIIACTFFNVPKKGACCNTNIAGSNCTNNVTLANCSGSGLIWSEGLTCAQVSCCSSGALCTDSNPCTTDTCVSGTGCVHTPIVCNDSNPCTTDQCVGGSCVYTPVVCPDNDGNPCTAPACSPGGPDGNCNASVPTNNGGACDDGLYCTVGETCLGGVCQSGSPRNCADSVACTNDSCDENVNVCVNAANNSKCSDGLFCNGSETCHPTNGCQDGPDPCSPPFKCDESGDRCVLCLTDAQCDDGLYCNGAETCNPTTGTCQAGPNPCPADSVGCTIDACDENANVCLHTPDDSACQNGLFCDGMEICHPTNGCVDGSDPCAAPLKCDESGDRCVICLTDAQCNDGLYCNGQETCNQSTGMCQAGSDPCPADSVACTVDACDEAADVCLHTPDSTVCQNGIFCDGMEICDPIAGCVDGADPCSAPFKCDESGDRCVMCLTDAQCNDGLYCNGVETCNMVTGTCQSGTDPCPPDNVACTIDSCDEAGDVCLHVPDNDFCQNMLFCDGMEVCNPITGCGDGPDPCAPPLLCDEPGDRCVDCLDDGDCDDGFFCNGQETCNVVLGVCVPGTDPCPADSVACTVDGCDEAADSCFHIPDHDFCQNGLFCDGMEICDPVNGCVDGSDPCASPFKCDEPGDRCVLCLTDAQCNDGLFCNGVETCDPVSGTCQPGSDPCPPDTVDCTIDVCDEAADVCRHTPDDSACQNGIFCDGMEICDPVNGCVDGSDPCAPPFKCDEPGDRCVVCLTDAQCNDGLFCNGMESCDPLSGTCQAGSDPCPPDNVACTIDACDEAADVCLHTPDHTFCQNGLYCDGNEVCDPIAGCVDGSDPCSPPFKCDEGGDRCVLCLSDAQCNDGLFCNGQETCNLTTGTCQPGTDPCPADGIACSIESCNETTDACEQTLNHNSCQNGLFCDGQEVCDPVSGCIDGPDPCTPDSVACTVDTCDEATDSCLHTPQDSLCSDGLFCNGAERCDPLLGCVAGVNPCPPDSVNCTLDSCDEAADVCLHTPQDSLCTDGLFCNGLERCDPVQGCLAGTNPCPPDSVNCTIDSCDEAADLCLHTPSDAQCSDGQFCNGAERCHPLIGCKAGPNPCPPDSIGCTLDSCDEATDMCLHTPVNTQCDDGQYCNGAEICNPGIGCIGGANPCPPDSNSCTIDACDEATDTCSHTPSDSLCSDELYCNGVETCHPVLGCQDGPDVNCSSLTNACNLGVCNEVSDTCVQQHVNEGGICPGDMRFCTGVEKCHNGNCEPPGNPCPSGTYCDEPNDECVECLNDGHCDDGDQCTDDICVNGSCTFPDNNSCGSENDPGACCDLSSGTCANNVRRGDCPPPNFVFHNAQNCANIVCDQAIPTVSEWGLAVLAMLLLIGAKLRFRNREVAA